MAVHKCCTFRLKQKNLFIAHPWHLLCVVGLEEYSAHDWRAATSVQGTPITWRQCGLCSWVSSHDNIPAFQFSLFYNLFMPTIKKKIKLCIATITDDSPHKGPVMRKVFPHYDIIMTHPGQWITCSLNSQLQCSAVINAVNFIPNPHNRHPIARPWGMSVVILICDSLSATVIAVSYIISW